MKRVFGAIAIVLGIYDITEGILLFSENKQYSLLMLGIGLVFIVIGVRYISQKKEK